MCGVLTTSGPRVTSACTNPLLPQAFPTRRGRAAFPSISCLIFDSDEQTNCIQICSGIVARVPCGCVVQPLRRRDRQTGRHVGRIFPGCRCVGMVGWRYVGGRCRRRAQAGCHIAVGCRRRADISTCVRAESRSGGQRACHTRQPDYRHRKLPFVVRCLGDVLSVRDGRRQALAQPHAQRIRVGLGRCLEA